MIPKGTGFPPARSPLDLRRSFDASAGEGTSEKIMRKRQAEAKYRINRKSFRLSVDSPH
jgi:hypothetical protein